MPKRKNPTVKYDKREVALLKKALGDRGVKTTAKDIRKSFDKGRTRRQQIADLRRKAKAAE